MSLVEEAKKIPVHTSRTIFTREEVQLATAWAEGSVTLKQVAVVLNSGKGYNGTYIFLARSLAQHVREGKV